jgi:hypothetical protein
MVVELEAKLLPHTSATLAALRAEKRLALTDGEFRPVGPYRPGVTPSSWMVGVVQEIGRRLSGTAYEAFAAAAG